MEYLLGILWSVLIGLILTRKLYRRYPVIIEGYWLGLATFLLSNALFYPYRFWRMWGDIKRFFL